MPIAPNLKCYFGCVVDGLLHRFPKPEWPHTEKFNKWKNIQNSDTQAKGDNYIYNSVRLCYRHFDKKICLPSKRLTKNAIPNLESNCLQQNIVTEQVIQQHNTTEYQAEVDKPSSSITFNQTEIIFSGAVNRIPFCHSTRISINRLKDKLKKLREKYKSQNKRILAAKKLSMSKSFLNTVDKLPDVAQTFIKMQLKGAKKPRGRRFTSKEKIMALTIFKQSPKAYRLLNKMFVLPSKRSLQKLLSAFTLRPGVNSYIFENLKKAVQRLPEEKKLVNLLFDEVSVAPGLIYNEAHNEIIGFEDSGVEKNKLIADHALVFMIKGIKSKTKQPVCFTFSKGGIKKNELKQLLLEIIKRLNNTGLKVVSTICDQSPTNMSVIKELRENKYGNLTDTMHQMYFEVDNNKVFPLFDTPHLLKGVRNNLLSKDATFVQDGKEKVAKWEHLKMLLAIDVGDDELRLVNKLTESHVNENKIKKMKVTLAAQVFSQRVSSALRFLARHAIIPSECEDTADFLIIFDKLFDSFNGHSYRDDSKIYKSCIKNNSAHFKLWDDLIPILETIKFKSFHKRNGVDCVKYVSVPSIKKWINNIKTFKEMWQYISTYHNINNIVARNFNQDPLENFFSNIRSNGVRNVNPNCNQFISAFKTFIINNYNSPHSVHANCEEDYNNTMQSLSHLLVRNSDHSVNVDFACDINFLLDGMIEMKNDDSLLHAELKKYVTGYVIKKCKSKIFKNCNSCLENLRRPEVDVESFIYEIDYTKKSLFHPSDQFIALMNQIYYMIAVFLKNHSETKYLKDKIRFFIDCACDFNILSCRKHKSDLVDFICNLSIKLIVNSWCLGINRLLTGKIRNLDKNDQVKIQAFDYYNKRKYYRQEAR